jgi:hypothetical protein
MAKHWIQNAVKNKGGLHRHLGVPEGEKIPSEKLAAAKNSKNPIIRREAALAHTLSGMGHGKKEHGHSTKHIIKSLYH